MRVLCVGRLVPDKNLDGADRRVRLGGLRRGRGGAGAGRNGPARGRAALGRLGRAGAAIRFAGYVAPGDLPDLYAGADVLALVSTYEPFGVAIREGAAAGLALLCSERAGAAGDVAVEGENALIVDPEDRDAIAAALRASCATSRFAPAWPRAAGR